MKIAIVGDSLSSRALAPYGDPSWEIWGVGNGYLHLKRATRYFELHRMADVLRTIRVKDWYPQPAKLGALHVLTHPDIPDEFARRADGGPSVSHFPFEQLIDEHGRYFTSSFAWLVAYVLTFPDVSELAVYGADMSLGEYATQKACFEHYLGIAKGRGIKVTVPAASLSLRAPFLYALETEAARRARSVLGDQRAVLDKEIEKHLANLTGSQNARVQIQARMGEHSISCDCAKAIPCTRLALLRDELQKALTDEIDSSKSVGQFRARYQENLYYSKMLLIPDPDDIDRAAEDAELPKWAEPITIVPDPGLMAEPGELKMVPRLDGQMDIRFPEVAAI